MILIAGGGIGGLTLALMLHKRGIPCRIYEQASELRALGVGINTLPPAIRELSELGLLDRLDAVGVRTRTLIYLNRQGQEVWREKRGMYAGAPAPQFSIHRGRFQRVLYEAVIDRLGPEAVRHGRKLSVLQQHEGGVTAQFVDAVDGMASETVRGDVLVGADGIHSSVRRLFYRDEGPPKWQGVFMWRGATMFPTYLDGQTMYIGGGMGAKFVLYPIAPPENGMSLTNWVVNVRIADGDTTPPPKDSWSRRGRLDEVLPYALTFRVPGFDIEGLVRATEACYEYPMADRDPLRQWTFGRVTLLGDAAHPMYPVGSNGASQAILDARCLADLLAQAEHPRQALHRYERIRRKAVTKIQIANRKGGPEGVIDAAEKEAPEGFADVAEVIGHQTRARIIKDATGVWHVTERPAAADRGDLKRWLNRERPGT